MRGIVLAGGNGTRLRPLTDVTNKHLLPIYDRPMIDYPIRTLVNAGIEDIMVVVGGEFYDHVVRYLKDGKRLGIKNLQYAFQEGAGGIAAALKLAEDFVNGDDCTVILGDNVTDYDISNEVNHSWSRGSCHLFLKSVPDPERFGVAEIKNGSIVKIAEKPKKPKSDLAVTGLYIYDQYLWSYINEIEPSARGELEITDINNMYLTDSHDVTHSYLEGYHWKDSGTFDALLESSVYWYNKANEND
jgi:glucose-1-phosphate thymidylyltransferase